MVGAFTFNQLRIFLNKIRFKRPVNVPFESQAGGGDSFEASLFPASIDGPQDAQKLASYGRIGFVG